MEKETMDFFDRKHKLEKEFKDFGFKPDLRKRGWNIPNKHKEFNLSEKEYVLVNIKGCSSKDIKEFIKRRDNKLRRIHLLLISNNPDDWDIASRSILDLINDKDKLAGDKLCG